MDLIDIGVFRGLIKFNEDKKYITYVYENKRRNYSDPEEKVQAETYLKLIYVYGYKPERIKIFVPVTMGSSVREADIIIYNDDKCLSPYIVVECKKHNISELEFTQAVEQAFSYAVPEGARLIWVTSGIKNEYYTVDSQKSKLRNRISDILPFGVLKLPKYKYVKGGLQLDNKNIESNINLEQGKQNFFELEVLSEDELTKVFQQCHNALWAGGELNPSEAFDELDKLIFCKIWDERKARRIGEPYDFQVFSDENPSDLLKRIKAIYSEGSKKDPEVFRDDIRLTAERIRTVVGYLERVNLNKTDLDSKGKAFETFMGSYFRGDFGQYFTPRSIVKFIVDVLPITNTTMVLDTSCGSGGFLLYALDKIRNKASEFFDPISEEKDHWQYWHNFASKYLYGIEINEQIARTAKMNMIIHDDGHTNVIAFDGLFSSEVIRDRTGNDNFKYNNFDFILTNPPFGSTIRQTEKAYLSNYHFGMRKINWIDDKIKGEHLTYNRETQATEILFIEQCYNFLKEDGYLAIILPDGILTNSSLQYVRDSIEEMFRIVAVVSLPQTAFVPTGAGVKSSILFLRKLNMRTTEKIKESKKYIQNRLAENFSITEKVEKLEKEKKNCIKNHIGFIPSKEVSILPKKDIEKSSEFKEWKIGINNFYNEQINVLKEELEELYVDEKAKVLSNYPVFMAIADDIGYDSSGKVTNKNDLNEISTELAPFIKAINEGKDDFFLLTLQ